MATRVKLDNYVTPEAPRLGLRGWLRWIWRQVTSMRVALILLIMLGLGSIPGSLLPQRAQNPASVRAYLLDNPGVGPWLDRFELFDVFTSAWFSAIYILLFASLLGCIIPRTFVYWRNLRKPPTAVPRSFARYPVKGTAPVGDVDEAFAKARAALGADRGSSWLGVFASWMSGYRVFVKGSGSVRTLAAEKGHLRELGNLMFHIALVGLLVSFALGTVFVFRGQAVIVEGRSFTNAVVAYDTFESGAGFDPASLDPFTLRLDSFEADFTLGARPVDFAASVTITETDGTERAEVIRVNHPAEVDGTKIYLQGNGYAPALTVRDADGNIAFSGAVPFLPQDAVYTSTGVIKIPDVTSGEQIGLKATLLPSAVIEGTEVRSLHPDPANPVIVFTAYAGDLGLDTGIPQNVYKLDESQLSPVRGDDGQPEIFVITPGQTVELNDGLGTVTWDALPRFVAVDLRKDPTLPWVFTFALMSLVGVALSLFGTRRRIWLVLAEREGNTVVDGAAWGLAHDLGLQTELDRILHAVSASAAEEPA